MRAITVIGSLNLDLVVETARLPRAGETVLGGVLRREPGGKGANQAAAAARLLAGLGAPPVRMVGCVGRDEAGALLRAALRAAGVDERGVRETDAPTGVALIALGPDGENQIVVAPGANALAEPPAEELDLAVCQNEIPWRRPRARTLIWNPAPAPPRGTDLRGVDWLVANLDEARALTGAREVADCAAEARRLGAGRALITLGARGVWDEGLRPALPARAVDAVGAGDVFVGALAAALAGGEPDPVRFAAAAAACKVERRGAQNQPARAEVLARLRAEGA